MSSESQWGFISIWSPGVSVDTRELGDLTRVVKYPANNVCYQMRMQFVPRQHGANHHLPPLVIRLCLGVSLVICLSDPIDHSRLHFWIICWLFSKVIIIVTVTFEGHHHLSRDTLTNSQARVQVPNSRYKILEMTSSHGGWALVSWLLIQINHLHT